MLRLRLLLLLLLLIPVRAFGQDFWTAPSDSFETSIDDLHVTSTGTALVGAFLGGIYRSEDGGATWQEVSERDVEAFAEAEGVLYAAGFDGVLQSTDDGETWTVLMPSNALSISVQGSKIAAGGTGGQLYLSEDGGASWTVPNCSLMP